MTSASKSYFNRIVATLNTTCAFNIYIEMLLFLSIYALYTYNVDKISRNESVALIQTKQEYFHDPNLFKLRHM